jgi:hypothetical protein
MKFAIGDPIVVKITNEEGKVIDIINDNMVMVEVKGVRFPTVTDMIDFPYFKWFTQKKEPEKQKIFIDQVKKEKVTNQPKDELGVIINFLPVYSKDVFDDEVVDYLKVYLINQTNTAYNFDVAYTVNVTDKFVLKNTIEPQQDFYLTNIDFDDLSASPRFNFIFSLKQPDAKRAAYYERSLKLTGKQVFKKIEQLNLQGHSTFGYELFINYPINTAANNPDDENAGGLDLSKLKTAGFSVVNAGGGRKIVAPAAQSVVDLHIEKITENYRQLKQSEILSTQLSTFEKFYDLAILNNLPSIIFVHGIGEGVLKYEIHERLKTKKEVNNFINQLHPNFGYGATEVFFK